MTTTDEPGLLRARRYDAQALAEIYDRHAPPVYAYLVRLLGDATQAEDLTSEVFLRLLEVLGTRREPRDRLDGWLNRVAHNLAMDHFRRQRRRPHVPLDEELVEDGHLLSDIVGDRMARQKLRAAILQLTAHQQRALLLRFAEERPLAEVAQMMGKSEGAVKILQHRAVSRLRRLLGE